MRHNLVAPPLLAIAASRARATFAAALRFAPMRLNSLAFRLFATAAAWTLVVLPIAGIIIYSLYRQDIESSFNDRLRTLLTVVLADSIDHANPEPGSPRDIGEPFFEITHSGWYWQIKPLDSTIEGKRLVSPSLATELLPSPFESKRRMDDHGVRWLDARGPLGQRVRVAEMLYAIGYDESGPQYSFIVAGPLDWVEARVSVFRTRIVIAFTIAGLALLAASFLQIRFGLVPLRAIERGLAAIRSGQATKLESELPVEIEPLQHELNALIQSNQDIIDRARTQVGNLAHALKTPLAVIANEIHDDQSAAARKVAQQAEIMRDQVNYYLDRARMAARAGTIGRITEVAPVAHALQRALERIYDEKRIAISVTCPEDAKFQGEKQDLEEMLGNLMDNACKWASSSVRLIVLAGAVDQRALRRLEVVVEDDGPGLTSEQRTHIGQRGMRLDETKPGSGLGLAIVGDLANSYHGRLELAGSPLGGLLVRLTLPGGA